MAKKEKQPVIESAESTRVSPVEGLTLEGLKNRYDQIKVRVGEKMIDNNKTISRLITEITIGSGTRFKQEKMAEVDQLLKKHEKNQKAMEKAAGTSRTGDALDRAINVVDEKPITYKDSKKGKQNEQKYIQSLWDQKKKAAEEKKKLEETEAYLPTDAEIYEEPKIKPSPEVQKPWHEVSDEEMGQKEDIYQTTDADIYTEPNKRPTMAERVDAAVKAEEDEAVVAKEKARLMKEEAMKAMAKDTFGATSGLTYPDEAYPQGVTREQGLAMAEAAKANMKGVRAFEVNEAAANTDLLTSMNVGRMERGGQNSAEIEKNLALMNVENLKKNAMINAAIESICGKIAIGKNMDNELKVLAEQLGVSQEEINNLRNTIEAVVDMDAREKMPKPTTKAGKAASKVWGFGKFAGWMGMGSLAWTTGGLAIPAVVIASALNVVLNMKVAAREYKEARAKSEAELTSPESNLKKVMAEKLVSRLVGIKQEQINYTRPELASLPGEYIAIRDAKNSKDREKLIADNAIKLERLGEQVYESVYKYYQTNRGELTDGQLETLAKNAKSEWISIEHSRLINVINGVVNKSFDGKVESAIDRAAPGLRDKLKGTGMTENQSQLRAGAVALGMGGALRASGPLLALQGGAFLIGGMGGEWLGNKLFGKRLNYLKIEDLQKLERDPLKSLDIISQLQTQMDTDDFKQRFPDQLIKLEKWFYAFDQEFLSQNLTDREKARYLKNRVEGLKEWKKVEKNRKDLITFSRWAARGLLILGATQYLATHKPEHHIKPVVEHPVPVEGVHGNTVIEIQEHEGYTDAVERVIGSKDSPFTSQQLNGMVEKGKLALEHAHQQHYISNADYNRLHETLYNQNLTIDQQAAAGIESQGRDLSGSQFLSGTNAPEYNFDKAFKGQKFEVDAHGTWNPTWHGNMEAPVPQPLPEMPGTHEFGAKNAAELVNTTEALNNSIDTLKDQVSDVTIEQSARDLMARMGIHVNNNEIVVPGGKNIPISLDTKHLWISTTENGGMRIETLDQNSISQTNVVIEAPHMPNPMLNVPGVEIGANLTPENMNLEAGVKQLSDVTFSEKALAVLKERGFLLDPKTGNLININHATNQTTYYHIESGSSVDLNGNDITITNNASHHLVSIDTDNIATEADIPQPKPGFFQKLFKL